MWHNTRNILMFMLKDIWLSKADVLLKIIRTPKSCFFCEVYLLVLIVLEIKIEKVKKIIYEYINLFPFIKITINPLHVTTNNTF